MSVSTVAVVARSSGRLLEVRVDDRLRPLTVRVLDEIAAVVDVFAYGTCGMCGVGVGGHVVKPGRSGRPFLFCEKGED